MEGILSEYVTTERLFADDSLILAAGPHTRCLRTGSKRIEGSPA